MSTHIPLIFGAAPFATRVRTLPEAQDMIDLFVRHGHKEIDTSRLYGAGTSEEFLGQLDLKGSLVDTKIFPLTPGDHAPAKLRSTFEASLKALGPYTVNIYYLHMPDRSVPYEDTLREINELYKAGLFKEFGLSNFHSWEVAEVYYIAKSHGWVLPTVYQGIYNALQRSIETELIPCLRKFDIRFYAYSPLANGILAGKIFSSEDMNNADPASRWNNPVWGERLRKEYLPLLPVFKDLKVVLDKHGITLAQTAMRWLQYHSALTPNDRVVIGASNYAQLESNLKDTKHLYKSNPLDLISITDIKCARTSVSTLRGVRITWVYDHSGLLSGPQSTLVNSGVNEDRSSSLLLPNVSPVA